VQLPPIPMDSGDILGTQFGVAYATSTALKWLKYQKWFPLMAKEAAVLNRLFSIGVAFVAAIGIHWTFDAVAGTMIITGLTYAGIAHGLMAWFVQFAMQQGVFKTIVQPEEMRQQQIGELPTTRLTSGADTKSGTGAGAGPVTGTGDGK
jgi:hypothetical protein